MRRSTGWLDLTGLSPPLDGLALVMPLLLGVVLLHHDLLLGAAAIGGDGRLGNGDAAPAIIAVGRRRIGITRMRHPVMGHDHAGAVRSEEHTSELQSLMRISYAVFCLKNKTNITSQQSTH